MVTAVRPLETAPPLVRAAQQSGLAFESSPSGRWIRLSGPRGAVYVVQDPWGEGCSVMHVGTQRGRRATHFLNPISAVHAAVREAG